MVKVNVVLSYEMLKSKPESVNIFQSYGHISIVCDSDINMYSYGNGVCLEGSEDDIKKWLRPYEGIWVYKGNPMLEQFEVMNVKGE